MAFIDDIDPSTPAFNANVGEGDDQIRAFKLDVLQSFPNVGGAVTATDVQLNLTITLFDDLALKAPLDAPVFTTSIAIGSAVISEAELEILDGATLSTTELNTLDGITATTTEINRLVGIGSSAVGVGDNENITGTWEWQDDVKARFGNGADVEVDYDSGANSFDIDLSSSCDLRVRDNAVNKIHFDNSANLLNLDLNVDIDGTLTVDTLVNEGDGGYTYQDNSSNTSGKIRIQTSAPSGGDGSNGDIWFIV